MRIFKTLVLLAVAALAAACAPMQTAAPQQPPRELKVIVFPGGFNWPLWVGQSQGFFTRNGVDVKLTPTPNSTFQLTGLVKGDFDIAITAIDNLVAYREGQGAPGVDGRDLVAIMGGDNGFLRLTAQANVQSIADLRGKDVSVDALTTGYAFVLLEVLERNGLVLNRDYRTPPAGGVLQRYEQLIAGKHAATMLISPFEVLAQERGLRVLADASAALGSYQGLVGGVRRTWAQQNPQAVTGYIKGYQQALTWLYEPRNKDAALQLFIANVPGATMASAQRAYDILLHPVTGFERRAKLDEAGARTAVALREKYGQPKRQMQPVSSYYEPRYYDAASR